MKKLALLFAAAMSLSVASAAIDSTVAANIALAHARVSSLPANALYVALDRDDGRVMYEVLFHDGTTAYEYKVDIDTGAILKSERKALPTLPAPAPAPVVVAPAPIPVVKPPAPAPIAADIGAERAKAVAFADAKTGPNTPPRRVRVEKDFEHGRMVYEIEFRIGRIEHDYVIDATNGAILKHEVDRDDDWF